MHGIILVLMQTVPCMAGRYVHACLYSVFIYFCKAAHVGLLGLPLSLDQEHRVAQTREVACTKIVLPQVVARGCVIIYTCIFASNL